MHVYSDDEEMVVAADENDARTVMNELAGGEVWGSDVEIEQMPDEKQLTIRDENESGFFETTKTYGEWAATKGRGYLCGPVG